MTRTEREFIEFGPGVDDLEIVRVIDTETGKVIERSIGIAKKHNSNALYAGALRVSRREPWAGVAHGRRWY